GAAGAADGVEEAVVVDQAPAAEDAARVQLEVVDLVAGRTPVEGALVGRGRFAEGAVERGRLPRPGVQGPGDVVGTAVGVADDAAAPRFLRHPGLRAAAGEEQLGALLDDRVERPGGRQRRRLGRADDARRRAVGDVDGGHRTADEAGDVGPGAGAVD